MLFIKRSIVEALPFKDDKIEAKIETFFDHPIPKELLDFPVMDGVTSEWREVQVHRIVRIEESTRIVLTLIDDAVAYVVVQSFHDEDTGPSGVVRYVASEEEAGSSFMERMASVHFHHVVAILDDLAELERFELPSAGMDPRSLLAERLVRH